ncbi:MAG: hypothetical protein GX628_09695 [Clostridiales bacterium]|mgnify:FL=1|nr:hypothetical protein [Clostridiales bacterium]
MKKTFCKIIFLLLAALLPIAVFISCSSGIVKITYEDGKYIDKTNGITYLPAGDSYEPTAIGEPYAEYDGGTLYNIPGLDPELWLAEEYDGIGSIFYSEETELPALENFGATEAYICVEDAITMHLQTIDNQSVINRIIEALTGCEDNLQLPSGGTSYHIKFMSETYPGIYYDILYVECDSGDYLYDRDTKQCCDAGRILKAYLSDTPETEGA